MENYIISPSLQKAVDIARFLKRPLLICGEPGTGKTRLAYYLAEALSKTREEGKPPFLEVPFVFNTKTTSNANDLFYYYDGLSRLRDAYNNLSKPTTDYITFNAIGKAIIKARSSVQPFLQNNTDIFPTGYTTHAPRSSVVLIDEMDKAPRDFPNDLLNEIEKFSFNIKEINEEIAIGHDKTEILVIMTSNDEKNFPDPFLRRCVFHYIDFPNDEEMKKILSVHISESHGDVTDLEANRQKLVSENLDNIVGYVREFRKLPAVKKPSTSEIINWVQYVAKEDLISKLANERGDFKLPYANDILRSSLGILFKTRFDLKLVEDKMLYR